LDDAQVQLGIAVAALGVVWYFSGTEAMPSLSNFATRLGEGFDFKLPLEKAESIPVVGTVVAATLGAKMNFVKTLHGFNTIVNTRGSDGFWLQNFANTLLAGYAVTIVPAILKGGSPVDAIFSADTGFTGIWFFAIWYLLNNNVCPVNSDLWDTVADLGGAALKTLMGFASLIFVSQAVGGAVGGPQEMFSNEWLAAVACGLVAANANNYFPFNKGFALQNGAAFAPVFWLASDGFAAVDSVAALVLGVFDHLIKDVFVLAASDEDAAEGFAGLYAHYAPGAAANGVVAGIFGHHLGAFVLTLIALNFLVGGLIRPHLPVATNDGFDVFGVVGKFAGFLKL